MTNYNEVEEVEEEEEAVDVGEVIGMVVDAVVSTIFFF